jgi:hypothetical protein
LPDESRQQRLRQALAAQDFRAGLLDWLEGLHQDGRWRLWAGGPPHLLPTCFAVFLRELLGDLPAGSRREATIAALLAERDPATGWFDRNLDHARLGPRHDAGYLRRQQTHFALLALRLLEAHREIDLPFLEAWREAGRLEAFFESLDWRDPWRESNEVMFALYFLEHETARGGDPRWAERLREGLAWLRRTQRPSGLWGVGAERRVYGAIYGAFHFLFFFLHHEAAMPGAAELLAWTRRLQTNEGLFAHNRGGGACEDYDCVDLLVKLGDSGDRGRLLRAAEAVLASRNADGGFPWARPLRPAAAFWLGNWMPGLSVGENLRLLRQRSLALAGRRASWTYSGLEELRCPTQASDVWSTWFRCLVLAEVDDTWIGSGARWRWRSIPSLGWHRGKGAGA